MTPNELFFIGQMVTIGGMEVTVQSTTDDQLNLTSPKGRIWNRAPIGKLIELSDHLFYCTAITEGRMYLKHLGSKEDIQQTKLEDSTDGE